MFQKSYIEDWEQYLDPYVRTDHKIENTQALIRATITDFFDRLLMVGGVVGVYDNDVGDIDSMRSEYLYKHVPEVLGV